jgi:hypothetical protein
MTSLSFCDKDHGVDCDNGEGMSRLISANVCCYSSLNILFSLVVFKHLQTRIYKLRSSYKKYPEFAGVIYRNGCRE